MNVILLLLLSSAPPPADHDRSVAAGREALDHWWGGYPWYDSQTDGLRRIELQQPADYGWTRGRTPDWDFGPALRWLAWGVLALVLAAAVFLLIRAYLDPQGGAEDTNRQSESSRQDGDRVEALPMSLQGGRLDLLQEARREYGRGNFGRAIVYLFGFQLVELDRRHVIRLSKGKTNRQYLREVGTREALRRLVGQTMLTFEDVFFGNRAIDRTRFEACWSRLDEFQSLAAEAVG